MEKHFFKSFLWGIKSLGAKNIGRLSIIQEKVVYTSPLIFSHILKAVQFSSSVVSDSLRPMDCSTAGFPVHNQLPEFTQTHLHWVGDAIQLSSSSIIPFFSRLQSFPASGSFHVSQFLPSGGQSIGVSTSTSVLPMNTQDWSPLGWTGCLLAGNSLQRDGLLAVQGTLKSLLQYHKSINSSVLSFLYDPTLIFIHDYWKNHSFDWTDLCWKSNVSAF